MPDTVPVAAAPAVEARRFTTEEYHRMAETGILTEDDRTELIEGQILSTSPVGSKHADCVNRLAKLLILRASDQAVVHVQNPVRLSDGSEPEPDLALLKPRNDYAERLPEPEDVLLVIEVADTSLAYDRQVKAPLYARHDIPELWLAALEEEYVEVYRQPASDGYGRIVRHERGQPLDIQALDEGILTVDDVLG